MVTAHYKDGQSESVNIGRPATLLAAERKYGAEDANVGGNELTMWMAWHALGQPGGKNGFEKWVETLEDLTVGEDESEGKADPS